MEAGVQVKAEAVVAAQLQQPERSEPVEENHSLYLFIYLISSLPSLAQQDSGQVTIEWDKQNNN